MNREIKFMGMYYTVFLNNNLLRFIGDFLELELELEEIYLFKRNCSYTTLRLLLNEFQGAVDNFFKKCYK